MSWLIWMVAALDFGPPQAVAPSYEIAPDLRTADLDGDGDIDIIATAWLTGFIYWWENSGESWIQHIVSEQGFTGPRSIQPIDVEGDGDLDLVGVMIATGTVMWWENVGGRGLQWVDHVVATGFTLAHGVSAGDIDVDGDIDIAVVGEPQLSWWENLDGAGTMWAQRVVARGFLSGFSVEAVDLDGDCDLDLVATAVEGDEIAWWENTDVAGTVWEKHVLDNAYDGATELFAADVDGDGDLDVLGAAELADEITWWENPADDGVWLPHLVDTFDGGHTVLGADLDADGDLDVVGTSFFDMDKVAWWENTDGSGTRWLRHALVADFDHGLKPAVGDLDGDGDLDVVAGLYNQDGTGAILWWAAQGCAADCAPAGGDGVVGILDFLALLAAWGEASPCDIGDDGVVGILDLLNLLAAWGPCP